MRVKLGRIDLRALALLMAALLMLLTFGPAYADGEASIRVVSTSITSEFPEGFRVKAEVEGDNDITSVAVRFRIGQQTRGVYEYLTLEEGTLVNSELFRRTNTGARYIPPGTIITYNFEIEDSEGNFFETEREEFIYEDARFDWMEVSEGPVSVAYHGPVKTRAEIIRDAIIETLGNMGPILGADTTIPIRVTMYNNVKEMLEALPPGSTTIRRELITEGQAFTDVGTLLVLGAGTRAKGTASHEVTHILTHRAGDSIISRVPSWLDEGLSEMGNIDPGFSYDIAMEFALATDRLLPITGQIRPPADPETVIIFYGEARSIVRFMVDEFGPLKMQELMAVLKTGTNIDDALEEVYGVDRLGLENLWRVDIRAETLSIQRRERSAPTPIPRPELLPFSLTPQAAGATIQSSEEVSTPTPEASAIESVASSPDAQAQAAPVQSPTPQPDSAPSIAEDNEPPTGGGCNAPVHGGRTYADVSLIGIMVGVVGLVLRRRRSKIERP